MTDDGESSEFQLQIPTLTGDQLLVRLNAGQILFCLGANGSGKSSLLHKLERDFHGRSVKRMTAHRQTSMPSSEPDVTQRQRQEHQNQLNQWSLSDESRWRGDYESSKTMMALFGLLEAEHVDNAKIAAAAREGDLESTAALASQPSPLVRTSELLAQAGISITIVNEDGTLIAYKSDGLSYGIAEMSDGERSTVILAAEVLTAPPGTLFLIDEPERHLHRSIVVPLLSALLRSKDDCAFVVATHEIGLPLEFPDLQALILRSLRFQGKSPERWDAYLLKPGQTPDEDIKRAVLGGRKTIVFVEGTDNSSLDRPLYQRMFPDATIVPMGNRRQVIQAVKGLRNAKDLAWVNAFGIVDRDFDDPDVVATLEEDGVFPLPWVAVESIYYHPEIQQRVAERKANALGGGSEAMATSAVKAVIREMQDQSDQLAHRFAVEAARRRAHSLIPVGDNVAERIEICIDVEELRVEIQSELNEAIKGQDVGRLIEHYSVKNTGIPSGVARALGFTNHREYEEAVIRLFESDSGAVEWLKSRLDRFWTAVSETADD